MSLICYSRLKLGWMKRVAVHGRVWEPGDGVGGQGLYRARQRSAAGPSRPHPLSESHMPFQRLGCSSASFSWLRYKMAAGIPTAPCCNRIEPPRKGRLFLIHVVPILLKTPRMVHQVYLCHRLPLVTAILGLPQRCP